MEEPQASRENNGAVPREPGPVGERLLPEQLRALPSDNRLPELFGQRLGAVLAARGGRAYLLAVHIIRLHELGLDGREVLKLISRPAANAAEVCRRLSALARRSGNEAWPQPGGDAHLAILDCCTLVFSERGMAGPCRDGLRRFLGDADYDRLILLLGHLRSLHVWVGAHPEMGGPRVAAAGGHLAALLEEEPGLQPLIDHEGEKPSKAPAAGAAFSPREQDLLAEIAQGDQIAEALRESEGRLGRAIANAPFPIMIYREDGEIVQLNQAWTELSGYSIEDVPTVARWMGRAFGRARKFSKADVQALLAAETRVDEGEYTLTTRAGEKRTWDFSSAPLGKLPDGRRLVVCMASDVSERRRLAEALWQSNRTMGSILESIADGFFSIDRNWKVVYFNFEAEHLTGIDREDAIGKDARTLLPPELSGPFFESAAQAMEYAQPQHIERQVTPGTWAEINIYPSPDGLSVYFRDISERKRIQGQLAFQAGVLANMNEPVAAVDGQGRIVYWNRAAERLFGYTATEMVGKDPHAILRTRWPEGLTRESLNAHLRSGAPWRGIFHHHNKAGQELTLDTTAAAMSTGDGQSMARLVVFRDVTEERRMQAELAFQAAVLANVNDAVVALDNQGRLAYCNKRALELFGYTADEVLGREPHSFLATRWPPGWSRDKIHDQVSAGVPWRGVVMQTTSDGRELALDTTVGWLGAEGGSSARLIVLRDVTEQRRMEEVLRQTNQRLAALIDASPMAIVVVDKEYRVETWSPAAQRLFGWREAEVIGRRIPVVPDEMFDRFRASLSEVWDNGRTVAAVEGTRQRRDGTRITTSGWVAPLRDADGEVRSIIAMVADITERARAEEALRKSEATNRAMLTSIPDMLFRLSADGTFLDYYAVRQEDMAIPPERFLGRRIVEVMPAELAPAMMQRLADAMRTGQVQTDEHLMPVRGVPRWWEGRVVAVNAEEALYIIREVTDRRRAEAALRQSEEKFRSIFDNSGLGIFQSSPSGGLISVNPAFARMFGYGSPEEMVRLVKDATTDMYGRPEGRREVLSRAMAADGPVTLEVDCRRRDGSPMRCHVVLRASKDSAGNLLYVEGFAEEIARR